MTTSATTSAPLPLVAIVGRPNVGKSTFFNRLVGGRPALVHDTPGLTRDRRYGECDYFGKGLRLIDTGGLDPEAEAEIIGAGIHRQALRAVGEADALMMVVDGRAGVSPLDQEIARRLRTTGKPVFLVVNKIDHQIRDELVHEFHQLGLGAPYPVSAAHGRGIDALLDAVITALSPPPVASDDDDEDDDVSDDADDDLADDGEHDEAEIEAAEAEAASAPLRVAFVGKPNAGKSSLTNRLLGEERSLVHDVAGTTTDPVDSPFAIGDRRYLLVDTAGIRRKAKIEAEIEKIAVSMAISQLERADVVVLVIDAALGPSEQDARLAGMIDEAGRGVVLALNKADLVVGEAARAALRQTVADTFHFLPWAPVVMLSAQRGDGVERLLDVVDQVAKQHRRRIPTAQLNRFFAEVCDAMPPPLWRGKAIRINYLTQGSSRPPTFVLWANSPDGLSPAYRRFVANRLRDRYGFRGTPLRIVIRAKANRNADKA
jgi:GTP-binding protein